MLPILFTIHIKLNNYWVCTMYILNVPFHVVYSTCYRIYFRIRCYYRPTAWHTVADITEFHIVFSFEVYNDRWQPWHAECGKFLLFRYFSIFGFMCVIFSVLYFSIFGFPTNNNYVCRYKIQKRKANSLLTDFASNNPIS